MPITSLPGANPHFPSTRLAFLCAFASKFFPMVPRPATNLIRRRSAPAWLAIWRTWTGFANSQLLLDAAAAAPSRALSAESPAERLLFRTDFRVPIPVTATLGCCSDRRKSVGPSAPIAYATSVSPPDEAVAWLGRRYRVLDEVLAWLGRRYPMANDAAGCPWRSSCKSPSTRILVLGTSRAH